MKEHIIGDVFSLIRNGATIQQSKTPDGIPITRIETIVDNQFDLNRLGYASIFNDVYSNYYLEEGDILMSHINSVSHLGKVALITKTDFPIIHGMNLLCLKVKKEILLPKYAWYFFKTSIFKTRIKKITKKSVNQASFNISGFKTIKIPVPPLQDQIRITEILTQAENLITQRKESIALLDDLLRSTFLEMFGDPIRNEKGWNTKKLDKLSKLERGRFSPRPRNDPSYFGGKYPFIQTGDISKSKNRLVNFNQTLNEKGIKVSKEFKKGTIVIAIVGATIGATAILEIDVYATDSIIGISVNQELINETFLEFSLRFWKPVLLKNAPEAARANINLDILNKLNVALPPLKLQTQFAALLEKIETSKGDYQASLRELENMYGVLSQKAFKGDLDLSKIAISEVIINSKTFLENPIEEVNNNNSEYFKINIEQKIDEIIKNYKNEKLFSIDMIHRELDQYKIQFNVTQAKVYIKQLMEKDIIIQEYSGDTKQVMFKLKK